MAIFSHHCIHNSYNRALNIEHSQYRFTNWTNIWNGPWEMGDDTLLWEKHASNGLRETMRCIQRTRGSLILLEYIYDIQKIIKEFVPTLNLNRKMGERSNVTPRNCVWLIRKTVAPLKEIQSLKKKKKEGRGNQVKKIFTEHFTPC